jgi:hypothetical protein
MGWFIRKSFRVLPGLKINLSNSGPRLSVGVPGVRASVGLDGKTRLYGGIGPLRYQKTATFGSNDSPGPKAGGLLAFFKSILKV